MAELDLTNAFNDCIDRIAQGQSIDDCLRRYPQFAPMLRPMLEAGLLVQRIRVQPADVLAAQTRVRRRFEDALRAPPPRRTNVARRFAYAMAAILIVGIISVGSLSTVSQNSLPGDPMYGVKIFTEGLQRSLFDNDALEAGLDQRRIQEIQQLLALGRSEEVTFSGVITAQNGTNWVIASLPLTVPIDIPNATAAHIGDEVNVTARTSELHALTALTIDLIEPATAPLPTLPTNTLVPTIVVPTHTPSPTNSATPSLTPTLMSTNTQQPSPTKYVPTATPVTPTQPPTSTISSIPQIVIMTPTECVPTRPDGWISYKIQSGDTLSGLASGQSISLAELMNTNCMTNASRIFVGETIYLPKAPSIAPTATNNSNQGSGSSNSGSNNSGSSSPTDDHGGESDSGHSGSGSGDSGGESDDGSSHT